MKINGIQITFFLLFSPLALAANISALGGNTTSTAGGSSASAVLSQIQARVQQEEMAPTIVTPMAPVNWDATTCASTNNYHCVTPSTFWSSWLATGSVPLASTTSSGGSTDGSSNNSNGSTNDSSGYQINY